MRRRFYVAIALAMAALFVAATGYASPVNNDIIAMFPKDAGEFAYANLQQARQFSWFPQLKEQMLPVRFKQFEQFLASAGVDPNTQVQELAWALVPNMPTNATAASVPTSESVVGIALGQFNPESTEAFFNSKKITPVKVRSFSLYPIGGGADSGNLFFCFIDRNTAAFGQREQLEHLIAVRYGEEQGIMSNTELAPLINEANGTGVVWAVLDPAYTRLAMQQLAPAAAQFPQAAPLLSTMKSMIVTFEAGSGVNMHFQAVCATTDAANTLAALLQAGLMYQKYQAQSTNPDLAQMLDQATVAPSGDRLDIRLSLTDDQLVSLIRRNTFAVQK
jgi:hypothetical protein